MKKYIIGLMLSIVTTLALAIVPPEQIEKELASGNYAQARAHVEEVLQQKPENARAHLMKAFLLAHVDKDSLAAANELSLVKEYDKKGNVVSSPLFKKVENELYSVPTRQPKEFVTPVKEESDAFWWVLSIGVIVAVGASLYFFVFKKNNQQYYYTPSPRNTESEYNLDQRPTAFKSSSLYNLNERIKQNLPSNRSTTYVPQPTTCQPTTYQQPTSNSGMGFVGTAAAVGAGVVAGELVHDYIAEKRKEERKKETTSSDDSFSTYNPIYSPTSYSRSDDDYSTSSSRSSSWDSDSGSSYSSSSSSYSSSDSSSDSSSYSSSDSSSSSWD